MKYRDVNYLVFEASCSDLTIAEWEYLMRGHTRADKRKINQLVRKFIPGLYYTLALQYYNPYEYYKTKTHLILVHSGIEYFLRFTTTE